MLLRERSRRIDRTVFSARAGDAANIDDLMTDIASRESCSRMMGAVKGRDTGPELALRKRLHASGFRYSLHRNNLPGRPDLVLPRCVAAVFVHG